MTIVNLDPSTARRLRQLARIRREDVQATISYLSPRIGASSSPKGYAEPKGDDARRIRLPDGFPLALDAIEVAGRLTAISDALPRLIRRTDGPPPIPLQCGSEDGLFFARLPSGRIIYEHAKVTPRETAMFEYVKDTLPTGWGLAEYHMGILVQQRYLKYISEPGAFHFPEGASVAVDAGCYVGAKALAMIDLMGASGKVVAVEMGDENFAVLERNVEANGLRGRILPVHAAISDSDGTTHGRRRGTGMMGNTIVAAELSAETGVAVNTRTLASIFSEVGLDRIDYLNIQLNGAEPLAVAGLGAYIDRVGIYFVACPYQVGGVPIRQRIVEPLAAEGYEILDEGKEGRVIAFRPPLVGHGSLPQ